MTTQALSDGWMRSQEAGLGGVVVAAESILQDPGFVTAVAIFFVALPFAVRNLIRRRRTRRESGLGVSSLDSQD